jgi:hypothetical protein
MGLWGLLSSSRRMREVPNPAAAPVMQDAATQVRANGALTNGNSSHTLDRRGGHGGCGRVPAESPSAPVTTPRCGFRRRGSGHITREHHHPHAPPGCDLTRCSPALAQHPQHAPEGGPPAAQPAAHASGSGGFDLTRMALEILHVRTTQAHMGTFTHTHTHLPRASRTRGWEGCYDTGPVIQSPVDVHACLQSQPPPSNTHWHNKHHRPAAT